MKVTKKQLKRIIRESFDDDQYGYGPRVSDAEAGENLAGRLEDVAAAQEKIEEILNTLYDTGVENDGLKALLNNIIRDIDEGFVGEPT